MELKDISSESTVVFGFQSVPFDKELEKGGVKPVTRSAGEVHVDDIEDEKRHKEMLQIMHGLVQRPHERDR